jgi:hypothetical protein
MHVDPHLKKARYTHDLYMPNIKLLSTRFMCFWIKSKGFRTVRCDLSLLEALYCIYIVWLFILSYHGLRTNFVFAFYAFKDVPWAYFKKKKKKKK